MLICFRKFQRCLCSRIHLAILLLLGFIIPILNEDVRGLVVVSRKSDFKLKPVPVLEPVPEVPVPVQVPEIPTIPRFYSIILVQSFFVFGFGAV
jgi:hypothetical protein